MTIADAKRLARSRRACRCPIGCKANLSASLKATSISGTALEVVLGTQLRVSCRKCGYGEVYWPVGDDEDIIDADYEV